jgi:glycopeptide antibiotics resistance protein
MLSANAIIVAAGVVMIGLVVLGRARGSSGATVLAWCALTGAVAWILALTLFPIPIDPGLWRFQRWFGDVTLVPFRTIRSQLAFGLRDSEARQLLGNVALFVPFGFLLPAAVRACRRPGALLVAAAAFSVLIETLQAILPGHTTDVDDVILNTAGAALGFLAFSVAAWVAGRRETPEERTMREPAASSAG